MDNNLDATIDDSDYQVNLKNRLQEASEMILKLKDVTLTSVFVGELMELPHIEFEKERMNWLEDIYQDLSSNPNEQSETRSISEVDKLLLEELLGYFEVTLESLEKATVVPAEQPSPSDSTAQNKSQNQQPLGDATSVRQNPSESMQPKPKGQKELA